MKTNILKVGVALIFLALFNVLFFVLGGTAQSAVSWVSYGFIHAAYLMILVTPLLETKSKGLTVLSASLYLRAIFYFFTELIIGLVFIAFQPGSILWPLIIQSVVLAIFLVLQLMSVMANHATEVSIQKQRTESVYIKTMAIQVKGALRNVEDESLKNCVRRCYEALNNASIESFPEAEDAERALRTAVEMLCTAIEDGDHAQIEKKANRVLNAVRTRNDIVKCCRMNN